MNITQIEINLQVLIATFNKETFIYELLLSYGLPKASITRLRKGNLNLSKVEDEISWKKKLFFREEQKEDLHLTISEIAKELKRNERFVIVTDYETLLAIDTKTDDKLDIALKDLPEHYDFFLPWAGMEKAQHANENPADVKAAEKMAKLFDEIKKDNPNDSPEFIHGLNVFLSRLLFCFFAEDTHIFEDSQFTNAIDSHTQTDGSDLNTYLDTLFTVLNTPKGDRRALSGAEVPEYLKAFPFVNGGLFEKEHKTPKFSRSSRAAILNSGDQDWSAINPDIFGSMFQAVIGAAQRGSLGQHYTSVPNIMKVIKPLFLNELYEEFEDSTNSALTEATKQKKLNALLNRIHNLKIFDPACGSGNFLIIAYKELRILEMKIFKAGNMMALSGIQLSHFYGIEIDDFAGEIAKLALWLAEHQMNVEFFKEFGRTNPTLPLKEAGKIVQGNATRLDWEMVCPKEKGDEIYILGNPPYVGAKLQEKSQRDDLAFVFKGVNGFKNLDYIGIWFFKGAKYIKNTNFELAFVSTKSVVQGNQVGLLWPSLFEHNIEIGFGYAPFKWTNNAKDKAGVQVIILSIRNKQSTKKKYLFTDFKKEVSNIGPYLNDGPSIIVLSRRTNLSKLPEMVFGNMPLEGNFLKLSSTEKESFEAEDSRTKKFIKPLIGGAEFLKGIDRYCLWIEDDNLKEALSIDSIKERIIQVKEFRQNSGEVARTLVNRSHQFRYRRIATNNFLLIPCTTSERRDFMQCGFFDNKFIVMHSAQAIYDSDPYILGILSSKLQMLWVKAVGGYLGTSIRYSTEICYNTFPFPQISTQRKNEITQAVFRILEEREKHPEKTLAQLYDPDKMPKGLREAHRQNDEIIEKCYRSTPFNSDEERLEYLFKLYEKMIEEEKEEGTLFAKEKSKRKKGK
ncbi:MAG TPA: DNA methyltransferase [Bacteroidales bacterium]|nr:DNA methyltransferase [Bacteroidales bacterium]